MMTIRVSGVETLTEFQDAVCLYWSSWTQKNSTCHVSTFDILSGHLKQKKLMIIIHHDVALSPHEISAYK